MITVKTMIQKKAQTIHHNVTENRLHQCSFPDLNNQSQSQWHQMIRLILVRFWRIGYGPNGESFLSIASLLLFRVSDTIRLVPVRFWRMDHGLISGWLTGHSTRTVVGGGVASVCGTRGFAAGIQHMKQFTHYNIIVFTLLSVHSDMFSCLFHTTKIYVKSQKITYIDVLS